MLRTIANQTTQMAKKNRDSNFFICFEARAAVKRFDPGLFTYVSDLLCELTHVNT